MSRPRGTRGARVTEGTKDEAGTRAEIGEGKKRGGYCNNSSKDNPSKRNHVVQGSVFACNGKERGF